MTKIRITVLKRDSAPELAARYAHPDLQIPCQYHHEGQIIEMTAYKRPDAICSEAWKSMDHVICALIHGATEPLREHWMARPGVAIISCNDGFRPVTFKIERIDDEGGAE